MTKPIATSTGRRDARRLCESCKVTIKVGELRSSVMWPNRLLLTEEQMDLILLASGEFDRLCDACSRCTCEERTPHEATCIDCDCDLYLPTSEPTAVEFADWLRPDALNESTESPIRVDNQRRRKVAA